MSIIVNRSQIDDYIKCPFLFGKNVLSDKYNKNIRLKESISRVRSHIVEIASCEMKENIKLSLSEYRSRYTNKYFSNKKDISAILDPHILITRLNNIFSNFSDKAFIGYNIPVDISIVGTNVMYRDIIYFGLIDDEGKLTFIEIADFSSDAQLKDKLKYWSHYYTPYSFLASSFNKDVNIIILDPDLNEKIEMNFKQERFDSDYKELCDMVKFIKTSYLYKNFNYCQSCDKLGDCK